MKNKTIVVWFSCGAASAVAAKLTVEKYGKDNNVLVVNNPVDEEHSDNRRFLKDVEKWIGQEIIIATNSELGHTSAEQVWIDRKYMAGIKGAPCTGLLKKAARYEFERKVKVDYHVLGFTYEERHRHERFIKAERENVIPILIEDRITKRECFGFLLHCGIELPKAYKSYPNANCIGCPKATSPKYWDAVRRNDPNVFTLRAELSRKLNVRLVRYHGKRIFLDELPEVIERKHPYDINYNMPECGIFCDSE